MKKASSGRNLDANANLEMMPIWKCCPLIYFVQAVHMPRSENGTGVYRPRAMLRPLWTLFLQLLRVTRTSDPLVPCGRRIFRAV